MSRRRTEGAVSLRMHSFMRLPTTLHTSVAAFFLESFRRSGLPLLSGPRAHPDVCPPLTDTEITMTPLRLASAGLALFVITQFSHAQAAGAADRRNAPRGAIEAARPDAGVPRVRVGLSDDGTKLVLPWFVDELIATVNAGESPDVAVRDYAGRLRRGL